MAETWTDGNDVTHLLTYLYDQNGAPIGLKYRNNAYGTGTFVSYFFEKNLQGDIVAVYNEFGEQLGVYVYDAWGNHTVSVTNDITNLERLISNTYNPFRYRGYYYDVETGFYYLQSRYYNPQWGRFLNVDGYINANGDLLGYDMYAYCGNNPTNYYDPCGSCIHNLQLLKPWEYGADKRAGIERPEHEPWAERENYFYERIFW